MIRKDLVIIAAALLLGCTSSTKESTDTVDTPLEKSVGSYIPEDILSTVTSKRRGKLKRLEADGAAWFSFNLTDNFKELKIIITNKEGSTEFIWPVADIRQTSENVQIQNEYSEELIKVDLLIIENEVKFYFNEYIRFSYNENLISSSNMIEVYLDQELKDLPGVLSDIGN